MYKQMHKHYFFSTITLALMIICSAQGFAQLPANCGGSTPRIAIAGDSWAQYMADDDSHNTMLRMYGHPDKTAVAETYEICIGCIGSPGPNDYAVSGSEARQWADEANYDYLQNLIDDLNANPTIDWVVLSIGGNDILAGKSGGGWYKDMDLDVPGSEAALFAVVQANTEYIMDQVWLRARPNINFMISGYDFPNFNVSNSFPLYLCDQYACPKREDLSRDPINDLITDEEISAMMETVEGIRKGMVNPTEPRIFYDNGMGLMHYHYGYDDGLYPNFFPGTTSEPQGEVPFASGGDAGTPTDRGNFRGVGLFGLFGSFDADPIHLDFEGYEFKIKNQMDHILFEDFRKNTTDQMATFWSDGAQDGYVDIETNTINGNGLKMGDEGIFCCFGGSDNNYRSILSFNTSSLPDNAQVTGATIYMIRSGADDNPFERNDKTPVLDIKKGHFGSSASLEVADGTASANGTDVGCFKGAVEGDNFALRIDVEPSGFAYFNKTGVTQFRAYIQEEDWSNEYINFYDGGGIAAALPPDVYAEQNPPQYAYRTIKKVDNGDGTFTEIELDKGPVVEPREGYVLQEKLKDAREDDDGNIIEQYFLYPALEHPGLAKHMSEAFGAPADGFAPFIDISFIIVLPVELVDFSVEKRANTALLTWKTAAELNSAGFFIEHSTNQKDWQEVGFVASEGDSEVTNYYDFTHEKPANGDNYYRLKMVDNDATSEYSEIRHLHFRNEAAVVNIFPNPFKEILSFEADFAEAGYVDIQVVDVLGKVVYAQQIEVNKGTQTYTLNGLTELAKGNYLLQIVGQGQVFVGKVAKR
jgi:hypothetical protein